MKLLDSLLFVFAFTFFVIGTHQAIVVGVAESYWIFMFSLMPLFLYGYRKNQKEKETKEKPPKSGKPTKRKHG